MYAALVGMHLIDERRVSGIDSADVTPVTFIARICERANASGGAHNRGAGRSRYFTFDRRIDEKTLCALSFAACQIGALFNCGFRQSNFINHLDETSTPKKCDTITAKCDA